VFVRRTAAKTLQGHLFQGKRLGDCSGLTDADIQRTVSALIGGLSDPDNADDPKDLTVPRLSLGLLSILGTRARASVPAIIRTLKSRDFLLRGHAIVALGFMETDPAITIPPLLQILQFEDVSDSKTVRYLRNCVIAALGEVAGPKAEPAISVLLDALKDKTLDRAYRINAARALGKIGPGARSAVPALTDLLSDEDRKLSSEAAEALRIIGK